MSDAKQWSLKQNPPHEKLSLEAFKNKKYLKLKIIDSNITMYINNYNNIKKYANRYKYLRREIKGHKRSNIKNYSYRVEVPPPQDTEQPENGLQSLHWPSGSFRGGFLLLLCILSFQCRPKMDRKLAKHYC